MRIDRLSGGGFHGGHAIDQIGNAGSAALHEQAGQHHATGLGRGRGVDAQADLAARGMGLGLLQQGGVLALVGAHVTQQLRVVDNLQRNHAGALQVLARHHDLDRLAGAGLVHRL